MVFTIGCRKMEKADLIIINAKIYSMDSISGIYESMAIQNGKISRIGTTAEILKKYHSTKIYDLKGSFVYPGFIDAHCHFYAYGLNFHKADLLGTKSFHDVLQRMENFSHNHPEIKWVTGRGWDQNDWELKEFPDNKELNQLFPDIPVVLVRIDGHAVLANKIALDKAGIDIHTMVKGGKIEVKNGKLTGILVDNAVDLVTKIIPEPDVSQQVTALKEAEINCFSVGLTSVSDAGLDFKVVKLIDSLQKKGVLKIRIYAMLNPTEDNVNNYLKKGIYKTEKLYVGSIKLYADGALGSRGACLLEPYHDKGQSGFILNSDSYYRKFLTLAYSNKYQVNTHAIGDSANRYILQLYGSFLKGKNDRRWRIEHAQVIGKDDFYLFGKYSIIPSVQTTHATSDMYWAEERLGPVRVKNAYTFRKLMDQNGWLPNGTDFPVEAINPLFSFYSAVYRIDQHGFPTGGFQIDNALTPEQALKSITIWAAKASFEEKEKGSLETGKFADFVVLDTDLIKALPTQILKTVVLKTFLNGEEVY